MIVDGWVDWAKRRPGPANKVYAEKNKRLGICLHSMEGWLEGSFRELDKPDRQASWTFSLSLTGDLYQHYSVDSSIWASGNFKANTSYVALELEGLASMPINAPQLKTLMRLLLELGYTEPGVTIREHRQVWNLETPNAGPTACPSERYAPLYAALKEENDMTTDEVNALIDKRIKALQDSGALASTTDVLSCVAQIAGSEPLTYSDKVRVDAARKALGKL